MRGAQSSLRQRKSINPAYRPMLATLVNEPFDDKEWVFETKWDGFRLITEKRGKTVRLWSRNGIDVTSRYAVLLQALQKIEGSCVVDGEICALDPSLGTAPQSVHYRGE